MTTATLYKYATWALLVLNLCILFFFSPWNQHLLLRGPAFQFREQAVELLQLDENQRALFIAATERHHQQISQADSLEKPLILEYFLEQSPAASTTSDSLKLQEISELHLRKITATAEHFQEIKEILGPGQADLFPVFLRQATRQIMQSGNRRPLQQRKSID